MPNYGRYAQNSAGVTVQPLDYTAPNAPTAQSYHGFALTNGDREVIGRISSFNPTQNFTRNHQFIYELNSRTFGLPVDVMPGVSTGFSLSFVRVELWGQEIETVLQGGGTPYNVLNDQVRPVQLYEYLQKGGSDYMVWTYKGCWFTGKNHDNYTADGDGIIRVNCDLVYIRRELISSNRL